MHPDQKVCLYKPKNGIYYYGIAVEGKRRWKSTGKKYKSEALLMISGYRDNIISENRI